MFPILLIRLTGSAALSRERAKQREHTLSLKVKDTVMDIFDDTSAGFKCFGCEDTAN